MEQTFWQERWSEGRTAFHRGSVSDELLRYEHVFVERGAVLVPLCGKTLDLTWLAARFERVVGVEFVRQAAVELFEGQGVTPVVRREGAAEIFEHENLQIRVQDVFDVRAEDLPPIDAVWDRAALVALPPDVRPRYAAHILSLMGTRAIGLLVTLDYDQAAMPGPPFAVSDAEVERLFPHALRHEHKAVDERRPALLPEGAAITTSVFTVRADRGSGNGNA